nr:hypothetical protein [Bacteroidota bacterium]
QYIIFRDSLDNEGNRKAGMKSQLKYEFDIKQAISEVEHKKELENQEALASERSTKQRFVIWAVIGCLLLVALFAAYIFRTLSITKRQKKIIEIQNRETEFQKLIIEEKQKEIIDSINYARRIQKSQFPTDKYIDKTLKRLQKR